MNQTSNIGVVMWLLLIVAATFSILSIIISYRVLKKFEDFQITMIELLDVMSVERVKMLKDLEELKRRIRIYGNENKKEAGRRSSKD